MKFSARRCMPSRQGIKARLDAASTYHGVSLRLLLVDKQVDAEDVLPNAALASVHVVKYDAKATTLAELVGLVREAHRQNTAPFLSMAVAQHGADERGQWAWTSDLTVDLTNMHGAIDQLAPVIEVLAAALSKTKAGKAHIDLLACDLATTCKGLIPALEKMYGIDFRASTDETGNNLSGGDWKMETDNDYDVAADYLDAAKLREYTETMGGNQSCCGGRTGKPTGQKQKTPPQRPSTSSFGSLHLPARFDTPTSNSTQTSSSVSRYTLADGGTFAACVGAEIGAHYQNKRGPIRAAAHGRASVEASVSAKFKNSKESIAAEVSAGIKAVAEAEATASAGGVVAVKAQAQAQLEAFAKAAATATLTNIAASCSAGFTASVSGKCEIELGPFTFRFAATASVGLGVSAAFKAGWDKETGCFGFEADVAATVGAGAGISATVQFNPEFFLQWLKELIAILDKLAKHARDCQRDCQRSCGSMMLTN